VAIAVSLSTQAGTVPDLVSPAPSAEGASGFLLAATPLGVVNKLRDACGEVRLLLRRLIGGYRAGLLCGVDLRRRVSNERADETITALSRGRIRDLREGLSCAKLRFKVRLGRTEIGGCGCL